MATRFIQSLLSLVVVAAAVMPALSAHAAPTVVFYGSRTSVTLSSELVEALTSVKVTPGAVFPGFLRRGVASFPISSGEIDVANAKGEKIVKSIHFLQIVDPR